MRQRARRARDRDGISSSRSARVTSSSPPPLEDEPPHALRKINPENSRQPSTKPQSFFLRDVNPAPIKARPPIGSHIA